MSNKTLKVGIVGARGLCNLLGFQSIEGVEVTALCDLDGDFVENEAKKHGIKNTYRIFDDMLKTDIDCVVISTPMQYHVMQVLAALEAKKHVMSEVTAGVTMDELFWLKDAVEKSGCTYMMAENYNYIPQNQQLNKMVEADVFGEVYFAEGEYLHNIEDMLVYADGRQSWRAHWQLGKRGAFYPTHSAGPIMQWFKDSRITEVSCFGTQGFNSDKLRQDDTTLTICKLENGKMIKLRVDCVSKRPHLMNYYSLQGTKGAYEAPRGLGDDHKVYIHKDGEIHAAWEKLSNYDAEFMPDRYKNATEEERNSGHNGGDFFIVQDFIDAVRGIKPPAIDVYDACQWTAIGLLSEISITNGSRPVKMPDFKKITRFDTLIEM